MVMTTAEKREIEVTADTPTCMGCFGELRPARYIDGLCSDCTEVEWAAERSRQRATTALLMVAERRCALLYRELVKVQTRVTLPSDILSSVTNALETARDT